MAAKKLHFKVVSHCTKEQVLEAAKALGVELIEGAGEGNDVGWELKGRTTTSEGKALKVNVRRYSTGIVFDNLDPRTLEGVEVKVVGSW